MFLLDSNRSQRRSVSARALKARALKLVVYEVPIHIYINICVYMYEPILGQLVTILVQDFKVETEIP